MKTFLKTFALLPEKLKKQSILFIFLLSVATILETIGIGLIFPLVDLIINDTFTRNLFGFDLKSISLNYGKSEIVSKLLIAYGILIFFKSIYLIFFAYWNNKLSMNLYKYLSEMLLSVYMNMNYDYYFKRNSSDLIRNVMIECKNVGALVLSYMKLIVEVTVAISILIIVFYIDPKISILIFSTFLFFSIIYYTLVKKPLYNYALIRQNTSSEQLKTLQENFSGIKDIKLKSLEIFFKKIYFNNLEKFTVAAYKSNTLQEMPRILIELVFLIVICLIVFVNLSSDGDLKEIIPILGMYVAVGLKLVPAIAKVLSLFQIVQSNKPSIEVVSKEILLQSKLKKETTLNLPNINFNKEINLENIKFSYKKDNFIFNKYNFKIKSNSFVGIIGKSGQGKSTLVDIITGLLKVNEGKVKVDGADINNNIKSWQKQIGYVSQSIFLSDNTLTKNIAFGVPDKDINFEDVIRCTKDTMIYDFINKLENKFETVVGEKGIKLSGGQIQRLAIARELYRKPKLLILDEATSGLDEETENEILKFLDKIKGKISVIIVSHRNNTIKNCDQILDLSKLV